MLNKKQARQNLKQTKIALAEQISALRRLHKMTVLELATQTGVPSSYIEKLNLGSPKSTSATSTKLPALLT